MRVVTILQQRGGYEQATTDWHLGGGLGRDTRVRAPARARVAAAGDGARRATAADVAHVVQAAILRPAERPTAPAAASHGATKRRAARTRGTRPGVAVSAAGGPACGGQAGGVWALWGGRAGRRPHARAASGGRGAAGGAPGD